MTEQEITEDVPEIDWDERNARTDGPIHTWFGLTYSNYQVLHRSLMQSMPVEWQERLVACLEELRAAFLHVDQADSYEVTASRESTYEDLSVAEMTLLDVTPPGAPDPDEEHNGDANTFYDRDGAEHQGWESVLVPRPDGDPVPHYNRGRTFIAPARVSGVSQ